jgi:hypothetical protein
MATASDSSGQSGPSRPAGSAIEVPVPGSFAELTAEWLAAALRAGSRSGSGSGAAGLAVDVRAVAVEPLGQAVGLLGDLARLHIDYATPTGTGTVGPASVIVKLPASEPGGRQVGAMLRAWAREVAFYREIAPASPGARVPRCYHAAADPTAERWVVVLEDCPMVPVDPAAGASTDQAAAAVDALAVFHRSWWDTDHTFDWMPGFDTTGVGGLQGAWLDALPTFGERYGHVVPGPTGEWVEQFATMLGDWSKKAAGEPLTVVHADYRLDNLIFAPADVGPGPSEGALPEVTMIDWQTALRGPGAMDLTSFCATSLTIEARRILEPDLIARYLHGLAVGGLTVDPDWFAQSYDENLLWWMGQFANNLSRLEPDDPDTQRSLDTMIERTYTAALDRNVGRLLS